ncbi:MAG: hypothetical protein CL610_29270 [Anaerolineaceae bacterium]|nr:hypothetical protein [Anaerolineaceae bacterium]
MPYLLPDDLEQQLATLAQQKNCQIADLIREWINTNTATAAAPQDFRALVENIPDLIARYDRQGRYVYVNPALEHYSNQRMADVIGTTLGGAAFTPQTIAFMNEKLQQVLDTGQNLKIEFQATLSDEPQHFETWLIPEMDHAGIVQTVLTVTRDITEHKNMARRLQQNKMRYQAIVESQIDLVCRYTPNTVLTYVNDAYCRFFGKAREELVGFSFLTHSPQDQHESIRRRIAVLLQDPSPEVANYRSVLDDGREFWIQWVDHGIVDEHGQVIEVQAVGRDITQLKQLEEQRIHAAALEAELAKERELMALKDQFLSMVSHEFRAPLSVIKASDDILYHYANRMTPDRIQEHAQRISGQVAQMTQLLEDMLTLDRLRSGGTDLKLEPVQVDTLCRSIVEHFSLSDKQQHHITLNLPPSIPHLNADPRYLNRIIGNLLSNAIKYSRPGSIITLSVSYDDHNLMIDIADNGIGIPPQDHHHIFDTFFRAGNAQEFDGTGLGLAIVKQHVEAHGGSISFSSEVGQGTVFQVRLPNIQPARAG